MIIMLLVMAWAPWQLPLVSFPILIPCPKKLIVNDGMLDFHTTGHHDHQPTCTNPSPNAPNVKSFAGTISAYLSCNTRKIIII